MAYGDLKCRNLIWNTGSGDNTVVVADIPPKNNPTFTGTVTIPTAPASDVSTKAASTAFVDAYYATKAAPAFTGSATGVNLTLSGNLVVNGTTTTINTQTLDVEDINITLGKVSTPSDTTANNGGITLKGASDKTFNWLNATDAWTSSEHLHLLNGKNLILGTDSRGALGYNSSTSVVELANRNTYIQLTDTGSAAGSIHFKVDDGNQFHINERGFVAPGLGTVGMQWAPTASQDTVLGIRGRGSNTSNLAVVDLTSSQASVGGADVKYGKIRFSWDNTPHVHDNGTAIIEGCSGAASSSADRATALKFYTAPTGSAGSYAALPVERLRIWKDGQLGIGGANYGSSGEVLTSGGSGAAPSWAAVPPGGNTFTAVANGSIANNKTVKIDADGKVSEVKIQTTTLTPPTANTNGNTFSSGWGGSGALSATFVVSGTTYLWVLSAGSNVIKGRVDKLNATISSWTQIGTSYQIQGWQTYYMSAIFNSNLNKAAIFYGEDSGGQDSYCRVLYPDTTTSPPTMGSGSAASFTGYASNKSRHLRTVWDNGINSGNGRGIHAWLNCSAGGSQSWHLEYNTFTMANNNTFTFETSAGTNMNIFNTTNAVKAENWEMCGCGSGRFLVVARREDGGATDNQTWFRMGTINSSSNDITWGSTGSAFSSTIYYYHRICYDETSGKVIMLARASGDSQLLSFVGTISGTGSSLSISWGSGVQAYGSFSSMVGNGTPKYNMVYDPAQTKIMMLMPDTSGTTVMKTRVATISGTSVSWSTEQSVTWQGGGNNIILGNPTAVGGRVFLASDNGSTVYGTVMKTSEDISTLTEPEQYVGFADQAYTNGQTATIKTYGNVVDTLSGLTPGTKYYLQGDGTVGTSSTFTTTDLGWNGQGVVRGGVAGVAISSSKLLIRHAI